MNRALLLLALALVACADPAAPPPPSARCVGCHRAEYVREHASSLKDRKPPTCAVCHSERAWRPTTVRHLWPLTGAHEDASCSACHRAPTPVYEGTPTACVACHRAEYDAARTPPHARLALTCADCHTTDAWSPARDGHTLPLAAPTTSHGAPTSAHENPRPSTPPRPASAVPARPRPPPATPPAAPVTPPPAPAEPTHPEARFPITRGNHTGITCRRCHDRGGAMGRDNTDCVQCHARARFDDIHSSVGRYPQGSAAPNFCVGCHTRGTRSRR